MSLNLAQVLEEDSFSVGVFHLGGEADAVFGLPGLEFGSLGGLVLSDQESGGSDESEDESELLSVHVEYVDYQLKYLLS